MSMNTIQGFLLLLGAFLVSCLLKKPSMRSLPPGPKGLPLVGSVFDLPTTHQWLTFADWCKKWGDIMSVNILGESFVILSSAYYAIDILEKKSAIYSSRGRVPVGGDMVGWSEAMVLQPYGHHMREMRKLFGQVLGNPKRVERFQQLVEEETQEFLVRLSEGTDSLSLEIKRLAGSIIVMIAYGYKSSMDDDLIIKTVDKSMEDFGVIFTPGTFMADAFPLMRHIPAWFPGAGWKRAVIKYRETFTEMVELPYKWVREQMATGTAPLSFASALLEDNQDAEREYLIKMTAASLYAGGADTTVAAIENFFLAMTCFPYVQQKAQAEIDAVIGQNRLPSIADKDRLPYLHAIMLEILPWMPIAPLGFPHRLIEDDVHESYFLPKGTLVLVNIWKILHDPALYSDPMTFNPERFIASPEREAERDPRDFAFGFGRRKCPGIFFAEASVFAAIAQTLAIYNISKATDAHGNIIEPRVESLGAVVSHPAPFQCKATVRSNMAQILLDGLRNEAQELSP